jgi:hypothetical protein
MLPTVILPTILTTVVFGVMLCPTARADQTWLCAIASAVAVDEDGTIGPPDLGERERPTFFRVDAAKHELTLLAPASRRGEVTKIEMVHEGEGVRLFSGVEHGRGLNLIITDAGHMTLSIVSDGAVWSVFGHALPGDGSEPNGQPAVGDEPAEQTTSDATPAVAAEAVSGAEAKPEKTRGGADERAE